MKTQKEIKEMCRSFEESEARHIILWNFARRARLLLKRLHKSGKYSTDGKWPGEKLEMVQKIGREIAKHEKRMIKKASEADFIEALRAFVVWAIYTWLLAEAE